VSSAVGGFTGRLRSAAMVLRSVALICLAGVAVILYAPR
jgi:hypothetical protein